MATNISWADETLNFATGCTKVSAGCQNCYLFRDYPRLKRLGARGYGADPDTVTLIPERIKKIATWRKPRMVFINSMSDTFHRDVPDYLIDALFLAMANAPQHTFQLLTKRPGRVRHWWEGFKTRWGGIDQNYWNKISAIAGVRYPIHLPKGLVWPEHIWLGTSVESRKYLPRIKSIAGIAPATFLSAEPLLGPLTGYVGEPFELGWYLNRKMLQWVIVGGESGPDFREVSADWVADIQRLCEVYEVPYFFKQWSGRQPGKLGRELNGVIYEEMPTIGRSEA